MAFVEPIVEIIQATGVWGALLAGGLVGLGLVVIIYGRTRGILGESATAGHTVEFQNQLLDALKLLNDSEGALRRENAELREALGRVMTTVDLLRTQQRRMIDLMRAVMEGRLAPAEIQLPTEAGA